MVGVGLIENGLSNLGGGSGSAWVHALDPGKFNITIEKTLRHPDLLREDPFAGDGIDVWVAQAETLLESGLVGLGENCAPMVALCSPDVTEIARLLSGGVASVVLANDSPWNLAAAIHSAVDRRLFVSSAILTRYRGNLVQMMNSTSERRRLERLTGREHDVLLYVAQGLSNLRIAQKLHITHSTVGSHVLRILRKLNVSNRTEAARIAHQIGMTVPTSKVG